MMGSFFTREYSKMHKLPEQISRKFRALSVPVNSIDKEHCTGVIHDYNVSLEKCDCMDFQKRALPCKHMYRLAMEIGIIDKPITPLIHVKPYDDYRGYVSTNGKRNPYLGYLDTIIYNELMDLYNPIRQVDIISNHPDYNKNDVLGAISRLERNDIIKKSKDGRFVCWFISGNNFLIDIEPSNKSKTGCLPMIAACLMIIFIIAIMCQ